MKDINNKIKQLIEEKKDLLNRSSEVFEGSENQDDESNEKYNDVIIEKIEVIDEQILKLMEMRDQQEERSDNFQQVRKEISTVVNSERNMYFVDSAYKSINAKIERDYGDYATNIKYSYNIEEKHNARFLTLTAKTDDFQQGVTIILE